MSGMRATCSVTIQPTIDADGVRRLSRVILDRLWPDNAGGVHVLFGGNCLRAIAPLAAEAKRRGLPVRARLTRQGLTVTVAPEAE